MHQSTTHALDPALVTTFSAHFGGNVITPNDPGYDNARAVVLGGIDRWPDVVVRPDDSRGIAKAVTFARDNGLPLAVRSGGHSSAGHSVSDGGVTIDLSNMRGLDVDVEGRTAWAETGLSAGEYTRAVGAHGLATGFGDTGSVGIGGITLGGGVGFLSRKYGLTADEVLAAEVVTADGELLHVDADHHPDLFWALRGGGGNAGVVTRFKFRLREVSSVLGGMLMLPATAEVVHGLAAEAAAARDELSTVITVAPAPPMPFIPAELHGQPIVLAKVCYAGDIEQGERALKPFRSLTTPLADMIQPTPYAQMFPPSDESEEGHRLVVGRAHFADTVDRTAAEAAIDRISSSTAPMRAVELRPLGGAIDRVPVGDTAYAHRGRGFMVNVVSFYENADTRAEREAWTVDLAASLRNGPDAAYANFLGDEGTARVREAYPGATWDRLADVKRRYDPTNLFQLNHNVPPAGN